jgi:hypothetical protein
MVGGDLTITNFNGPCNDTLLLLSITRISP